MSTEARTPCGDDRQGGLLLGWNFYGQVGDGTSAFTPYSQLGTGTSTGPETCQGYLPCSTKPKAVAGPV